METPAYTENTDYIPSFDCLYIVKIITNKFINLPPMRSHIFTKLALFIFLSFFIKAQNYFQQNVDYIIDVKLDDKNHTLTGRIQMEYTNNSPDTLREIYIHLWPNAYKNNKTQFAKQQLENGKTDFYFAKKSERGYIDSLDFHINGKKAEWTLTKDIDIALVKLPEPLLPKQKMRIETPFFVKIPKTFSRLGHEGNSYQITQWYPKPAVYDKYGWHPYPYLDQGEFYSEFGSFVVNITVPKDYVVLATGRLITESEKKWLEERKKLSEKFLKTSADSVKFPTGNNGYKTLTFKQAKVHDFAWFAAKDYYYLSDTMKLPSGRIIKVEAAFFEHGKNIWKNALKYTKLAVEEYSENVGEYPYDVVSVVQGPLGAGAGMEYPTITILDAGSSIGLKNVIIHEVGHNWFYGILANDERHFPWMDEGINSFYENKAMSIHHVQFRPIGTRMDFAAAYLQWQNTEQPVQEWAQKYSNINYGLIVYMKTSKLLKYLENYLGEETFSKAMKTYYQRWKFKHPYPEDIKKVFEEVSGEDLSWFFDDLFSSVSIPDFALKYKEGKLFAYNLSKYEKDKTAKSYVYFLDKNNKIIEKRKLENLSYNSPQEITNIPDSTYRISINPDQLIFEEECFNNDIFMRKHFKSWSKIVPGFVYRYEGTYRRVVNFAFPVIGYNYRNNFMLGAAVHYQFFPKHNFELWGMPMYSFADKKLLGMWGAKYRLWFEDIFRILQFSTTTGYFADFMHTNTKIEGFIKNTNPRWKQLHKLTLKIHNIRYTDDTLNFYEETPVQFNKPAFASVSWSYDNWQVLLPVGFKIKFGSDLTGVLRTEFSGYIKYKLRKSLDVYLNGYVGNNLAFGNASVPNYLRLTFSGYDPFGEYLLFDRYRESGRTISRQLVPNQGNFRAYINKSSKSFLTSVNSGFLLWKVFDFRYDAGLYKNDLDRKLYMEFAGSFGINIADVVGVYFPVVSSTYSNTFVKNFKELSNNITFFVSYDFNRILRFISI